MSEWRAMPRRPRSHSLVEIREFGNFEGSLAVCKARPEKIRQIIDDHNEHQAAVELAARLTVLLRELFDYTTRLEGASSSWFTTRSYATRPDVDSTLGDRIRAALASEQPADGEQTSAPER